MEPNNNMQNGMNRPRRVMTPGGVPMGGGTPVTNGASAPKPMRAPGFANVSSEVPNEANSENSASVEKPKKSHAMLFGMIFLAILAAGGIGFGVWAMLDGNSKVAKKDEQIAELNSQLSEATQQGIKEDITVTESNEIATETASGSSANADTANYIYVGEWGLKIRIPDELSKISYLVDYRASEQNEDYLYINGVFGNPDNIPSFLNTSTEEHWLGCLHRLVQGEEPALRDSAGVLVTTIDGYEYYYGQPQAIQSTNEQDREFELETVDLIKQMLTNSENYSKI
ncbi:hypothetical protein IKG60_02115 [Candidatus Saccharibacteria bacterium]|nr:hypothetical protein [Candidatus Saccharibacteria bacterium]